MIHITFKQKILGVIPSTVLYKKVDSFLHDICRNLRNYDFEVKLDAETLIAEVNITSTKKITKKDKKAIEKYAKRNKVNINTNTKNSVFEINNANKKVKIML